MGETPIVIVGFVAIKFVAVELEVVEVKVAVEGLLLGTLAAKVLVAVELKVVEVESVAVKTSQVESVPPGILTIEVLLHFTPANIAVVDAPQVEGLLPGTPVAKVLDGMRQVRKLLQSTDT